ncbi:MAG TPA: hypothetical protein PL143_15450 [Rhodocyclaceae bacterium]|nr:hypothetical protein [Rhodocyclaceae bacterium]
MSPFQSERREHRRRILKAAAGVPVVLTLPSGAAMAAVSVTCDARSQDLYRAEGAAGFPTSPDAWMRVQLPKYSIRLKKSGRYVDGFRFSSGTTVRWFKVDGDEAIEVTGELHTAHAPQEVAGEYYYGLIDYQNGYGELLLTQDDQDVMPIAGCSCWNSLTGSTLTTNVIDTV